MTKHSSLHREPRFEIANSTVYKDVSLHSWSSMHAHAEPERWALTETHGADPAMSTV